MALHTTSPNFTGNPPVSKFAVDRQIRLLVSLDRMVPTDDAKQFVFQSKHPIPA